MFKQRKKRTKIEIDAIKYKITQLWGQIYYNPITTAEFFEKLGKDYNNISERENVYRYNRECQKTAEDLWDQFEIIGGDKEVIFKKWMDHCWLNKIPYIILQNRIAQTPKNYLKWQKMLEAIAFREIYGARKAIDRMASKDMELKRISARYLLPEYNRFIDLFPEEVEEEEEEIKEEILEEEKNEIIETAEEIIEDDVNNGEIKDVLKRLDQQAHEIEKMRMELAKKLLKNKVEDNEGKSEIIKMR